MYVCVCICVHACVHVYVCICVYSIPYMVYTPQIRIHVK